MIRQSEAAKGRINAVQGKDVRFFEPANIDFSFKNNFVHSAMVDEDYQLVAAHIDESLTRKPYGFMQSFFWVIMMVHVMVCGDL